MRVVVLIGHGPNWVPDKQVYDQGPSIQGHLEAMRGHYAAGRLLLGGPFDRRGGIAVLEVDDVAAADAIMQVDPAVLAGVMTYEVFAMTAYFDAFTGYSAAGSVADLQRAKAREASTTAA